MQRHRYRLSICINHLFRLLHYLEYVLHLCHFYHAIQPIPVPRSQLLRCRSTADIIIIIIIQLTSTPIPDVITFFSLLPRDKHSLLIRPELDLEWKLPAGLRELCDVIDREIIEVPCFFISKALERILFDERCSAVGFSVVRV